MGVVTEGTLEGRGLADGAIDQVGSLRMAAGKHIRLVRDQEFGRSVGELAQDRLAADDHNVVDGGDRSRRADDVLQLHACHEPSAFPGSKRS